MQGEDNLFGRIQENSSRCFAGEIGMVRKIFAQRAKEKLVLTNRDISAKIEKVSSFCKYGCAACCCQVFPVSRAEITGITFHLLENLDVLGKFVENFLRNDQDFPERERLRNESIDDPISYLKRKIRCEFLSAEDACLIYEARPLVCSSYISIAPPRLCSFEPKGDLPREVVKLFLEAKYWFQIQSKSRYPESEELVRAWPMEIMKNLLTIEF